jgi:hypothetical protein
MLKKNVKLSKKQNSLLNSTINTEGPCLKAHNIVNIRSEEQNRKHGDFTVGMIKASTIASILCNKNIQPDDVYKVLMALKLSRIAHSPELDSLTDLCGYTEGLYNYLNEK